MPCMSWASGTRFAYVDLAFVDAPPLDLLRSVIGTGSFVLLDEDADPVPLTG